MTTRLEFNALPSVVHIFIKALTARRPSLLKAGQTVGRIEAGIEGLTAEPEKVRAYNALCGFPDGEHMPPPYPHILAFPLQLAILSSDAFPIRLPGLVHVSNRLVQHEPVALQEPLHIECAIEGHQDSDRGQEFEENDVPGEEKIIAVVIQACPNLGVGVVSPPWIPFAAAQLFQIAGDANRL